MGELHTGNTQPVIDQEEHDHTAGVATKRVLLYGYIPGSNQKVKISAVDNGDGTYSMKANAVFSGTIGSVTVAPSSAVVNGQKLVAVTGTAIVLGTSTALTTGLVVQALDTNAGDVYVGNSTVTIGNGFQLQPGQATGISIDNLNKVFVNGTATDGVCFIGG